MNDAIDPIARSSGRSKRLCKSIIIAIIPDGSVTQFTKPTKETQFLEDATNFVLSLNNDDEKKLITDMREFNWHGNKNHSRYDLFWEYCICVKDLENVSGVHHLRKAAADTDTTTHVSFDPGLL